MYLLDPLGSSLLMSLKIQDYIYIYIFDVPKLQSWLAFFKCMMTVLKKTERLESVLGTSRYWEVEQN